MHGLAISSVLQILREVSEICRLKYTKKVYTVWYYIDRIEESFIRSYFLQGSCFIDGRKKVAFICVHNSCRSQIAEALGKHLASDVFESYSAGTETKPQINQDAVRIMKKLYGIDMETNGQYSKLITDIPDVDIAISMGCNVGCPFIGRPFDDNWGLDDPTGKDDVDFIKVINQIELKIKNMIDRMK